LTLDDLKLTVARTTGPELPTGTAFLLSATHALTCAHCIRTTSGRLADALDLYFSNWNASREQHATVEAVDEEQDVALLKLTVPATAPAF